LKKGFVVSGKIEYFSIRHSMFDIRYSTFFSLNDE
jgi:hypothetical protein